MDPVTQATLRRTWRRLAFVPLAFIAWLGAAASHSVERPAAIHGGIAQAAGPFHLELVVQDRHLRLFISDKHNVPVAAEPFDATALVWTDQVAEQLRLTTGGAISCRRRVPLKRHTYAASSSVWPHRALNRSVPGSR